MTEASTSVCLLLATALKTNSITENPYIFDTFNIENDDSAKPSTCKLQYGNSEFYPEDNCDERFKDQMLNDLINYRYRKNDYNTGIQLHPNSFGTLYPVIYFDLR